MILLKPERGERGDLRSCFMCGDDVQWGSGHKIKRDEQGAPLWVCCDCFDQNLGSVTRALAESAGAAREEGGG